ASEAYLVDLFEDGKLAAIHANHVLSNLKILNLFYVFVEEDSN
ncbi:14264_t:CDS:1, partial [Entrophospora sp. SA101]